jgi:uncharacterized protein YfaS (alpha-2-macroglobulin family)
VGDAAVTVRLTGPGGAGVERSLPIRVSPGSDAILRRVVRRIAPNESLTVSADLAQDLLPGSGSVSTSVSLFGGIDVPALLAALDRYPYGCTEQIDQPRAAAALCQPTCQPRAAGARRQARRTHPRCGRPGAGAAGFERLVRGLVGRRRRSHGSMPSRSIS